MLRSLLLVPVLAAAVGCGSTAEPDPVPARIAISRGDNQTAPAGTVLPTPLGVRVSNAAGEPLQDVEVEWTEDFGGGMPTAPASRTSADGEALMSYQVGPTTGINTVLARVSGTSLTVLLTAFADTDHR